jgi:hypothetical protein
MRKRDACEAQERSTRERDVRQRERSDASGRGERIENASEVKG